MSFLNKLFGRDGEKEIPNSWQMPVQGQVITLEEVPDSAFASGSLGTGFAIVAEDNEIVSPVDGVISELFSTLHAVSLQAENGLEVLVHIGIDTVSLQGRGFTALVSQGETVYTGQPLVRVDWNIVKNAGLHPIVPVIFTNAQGRRVQVKNGYPYFV